jgi:hypothetical protein
MVITKHYIFKFISFALIFVVLTILTQIGGLIFLCCLPLFNFISSRKLKAYYSFSLKAVSFITLYTVATFLIVPPLAQLFGRTPLPTNSETLKPASMLTVICNRHYVKQELKRVLLEKSKMLSKSNKELTTYYLDANFPFVNGFPLLPHLSHNDGKKVDIAFYYTEKEDSNQKHGSPSPIGYGVGVLPKGKEINSAQYCTQKGYWQYNIIDKFIKPFKKNGYYFNEKNTYQFLKLLANDKATEKIFIEPFLVKRSKINSPKIRFHGCHAVSHADHIHIQIK